MVRWLIIVCWSAVTCVALGVMALGDGTSFVWGSIALFVSVLVYAPMLEEAE